MADTAIHATAIVEDGAKLGAGVKLGPYCVVGRDVTLGDGVELISHVVVAGTTTIGAGTKIFPFASIGLSDKYAVETPSIAEFGFDHDGQFDRAIGEIWPGIPLAESRLVESAAASGKRDTDHRRDLQQRYRNFKSWLSARDVEAGQGE